MPSWRIEHVTGDVGAFHARPLPADQRTATFFRAESATLVLGSAQRVESVDSDAAARQGITIVRRRSGGGGVLLIPGDFVWLDLEIPADDELWQDDVGRSMWWVGELWRARARHARASRHGPSRCDAAHAVVVRHLLRRDGSRRGDARRRQVGGDLATPHPPRRSFPDDDPPTLATRRRCIARLRISAGRGVGHARGDVSSVIRVDHSSADRVATRFLVVGRDSGPASSGIAPVGPGRARCEHWQCRFRARPGSCGEG